jgi:hypothetical protein
MISVTAKIPHKGKAGELNEQTECAGVNSLHGGHCAAYLAMIIVWCLIRM